MKQPFRTLAWTFAIFVKLYNNQSFRSVTKYLERNVVAFRSGSSRRAQRRLFFTFLRMPKVQFSYFQKN